MKTMPQPAPDAPILCWSAGRSKQTVNWTPILDQSWSGFVHWLKPDKPAADKEVRPYVGATLQNGKRTIRTVEQRFLLTLDADYASEDFVLDSAIELSDIPHVLHTTWRHLQGEYGYRYRLIIPLSRGVTPNEYKNIAWAVMNRLGGEQFDVSTAQAERFMWGPSTQDEKTYYWRSSNAGAAYLPVEEWLGGQHGPSDAPAAAGGTPVPPGTRQSVTGLLEPSAEDRERAVEILEQACEKVRRVYEDNEYAGRNEAVFHLMPLLFRFCDADALDENLMIEALWEAAQSVEADEPYERREFNASVRSARQYAFESGPALPETTTTRMAIADFEGIEVDADIGDLWEKTPRLKHIAVAADSLGRNRLAVLAVTLLRVLHEVHPDVKLPGVRDGGVGKQSVLNLGVALVGSSGQGKSTIMEETEHLLDRKPHKFRHPSTGQGLIQSYLEKDKESGDNVLISDPRVFFNVDEVETLSGLSKDSGSTLLSEMRTMLTGGSTGSANATAERQRSLRAGSYNFQIVIGVQPTKAGVLLDGSDAGTPQRFVWVEVTDPKNAIHPDKRPEWPGVLDWNDAFLLEFELGDPIVRYPDWLKAELREYDYKISLEGAHGGELSKHGHHNLLRLKVAAAIAFLHESPEVGDLHVEIADMILGVSKSTQRMCERAVAEAAFLKKKAAKNTEERVSASIMEDRTDALVGNARKKLLREKGEWVRWQDLRPAYRDRAMYEDSVWEALDAMDDVECKEEPFGDGVRRKARIDG